MLQAFTTLSCRKLFIPDAVHNSKTLQLLLCMLPWVSCLLERNENYLSMQGLLAFHDKKQFRAFWERMVEIIGMLTACILTRHIYFCVFMIVWVIMYCNSKLLVNVIKKRSQNWSRILIHIYYDTTHYILVSSNRWWIWG